MERENATTQGAGQAPPRELVRPIEGRVLAGVAQGLAVRYTVPVWVIRLAFILLTFSGGLGLVLYAAGWFLIRGEDETEAAASRVFSGTSSTGSWIGIILVFIGAVVLLENYTFLDGGVVWALALLVIGILLYTGELPRLVNRSQTTAEPASEGENPGEEDRAIPSSGRPTDAPVVTPPSPTPPNLPAAREQSYLGRVTIGVTLIALGLLAIWDNVPGAVIDARPRHYMALALAVIGVGLMVGAFIGRARWLILLGVLMVPTLLFSPVFEYDVWDGTSFDDRVFDQTVRPTSFQQLEDDYDVEVGNLVVDLRDLPWDGRTVALSLTVDAGNIEVLIPAGVAVSGEAAVDVGRVFALGQESGGLGNPRINFEASGERGHVEITAEADVGNIEIRRVGG